jgi:hypothetical protein
MGASVRYGKFEVAPSSFPVQLKLKNTLPASDITGFLISSPECEQTCKNTFPLPAGMSSAVRLVEFGKGNGWTF